MVVTVTTVMVVIVGMLVGRMRLLVRGPLHLVTHDAISVDGWPRHEGVIGKPRSFNRNIKYPKQKARLIAIC